MLQMFNKMADCDVEMSDAVIYSVPDEITSESRANETIVSVLVRLGRPAPSSSCKCSARVFLRLRGTEIRPTLYEIVL